MDRPSRLALRRTIRCHLVCFGGCLVGYFVAPLFGMNNAQDRLLVACYFVAPLFVIEMVRTVREIHLENMRAQNEERAEWNRLLKSSLENPKRQA